MKDKTLYREGALRFCLLALCGVVVCGCGHKKEEGSEASKPVRVRVMTASPTAQGAERQYSGTVAAGTQTPLSFGVPGTVKSVRVKVGDKVAKGALIATLDHTSLQNSYDIAAAELAQAQDAYNRLKILHERRALAEIKWVDIQSKLRQAQAAVGIARKALDDANLYAPFAGTISQKLLEEGATAAPGLPVVTLLTQGELKVNVAVPQNQIAAVSVGDSATIAFPDLGGRSYRGRLTEKGVQADALTRSYRVQYAIKKPTADILPGMTCTLTAQTTAQAEAPQITVPLEALLLSDTNQNFVWLCRGGRATRQDVSIGAFTPEGDAVEITEGLASTDSVIVAGMQRVSEGSHLEITK